MAINNPISNITATYDRPLLDVYSNFVQYMSQSAVRRTVKEVEVVEDVAVFLNGQDQYHHFPVLTLSMDINTLTQLNLNSIQLTAPSYQCKCQPIPDRARSFLSRLFSQFKPWVLLWLPKIASGYILPEILWVWKHFLIPLILAFTIVFIQAYFRNRKNRDTVAHRISVHCNPPQKRGSPGKPNGRVRLRRQ